MRAPDLRPTVTVADPHLSGSVPKDKRAHGASTSGLVRLFSEDAAYTAHSDGDGRNTLGHRSMLTVPLNVTVALQ